MAVAGYCRVCAQYVWLNEQWGCVNGHPWNEISNWYDPANGTQVTPYWLQQAPASAAAEAPQAQPAPAAVVASAPEPEPEPPVAPEPVPEISPEPTPAPAPAAGTRLALLADVLALFAQYPNYRAQYGTDTDIVIDNQVADAVWAGGKKKVDYSAIMKAVEPERTVYFWEMLKEKGGGLSFGGFESETYTTVGATRSGTTKGATVGPGGVVESHTWDYGVTRQIVESVAAQHGWSVKTVLKKKSASW